MFTGGGINGGMDGVHRIVDGVVQIRGTYALASWKCPPQRRGGWWARSVGAANTPILPKEELLFWGYRPERRSRAHTRTVATRVKASAHPEREANKTHQESPISVASEGFSPN